MKDIKTKEVTTKPKTKNPASRIPKELMRTAILESREKSQTIANARDNDMGEQSPSEYGFDSHVAWCACFASWCGDQAGLIESGKMPKFSLCDDGIAWFQSKGKWKSRGYSPAPGTLIFFDWNGDGTSDHVGIVEKTEGSTVYTVEGNSSDAVNQRSYDINNGTIMGYGIL